MDILTDEQREENASGSGLHWVRMMVYINLLLELFSLFLENLQCLKGAIE